jgi:hypothetical protein
MNTQNKIKTLLTFAAVAMATLALAAATASAGEITYVPISGDADSGISTDNTYTHAIDFGTSGVATVNGVVFATDINIAAGGRSNSGTRTYGPNPHAGNTPPAVTGDVASVFTDMVYNGPDLGYIELTGLTSGQRYDLRLYERAWDYQGSIRTFYAGYDIGSDGSVEFTTPKINQNDPSLTPPGLSGDVSYVISYVYQADASGKIKVIIDLADDQTGTYHLYGLTNEESGPVYTGGDMITVSGLDVQLAPSFIDGYTPMSYLWTTDAPAGFTVVFDPSATVEAPTVTITQDTPSNPSTVAVTLLVNGSDQDTMKIDVYDDACLAAKVSMAELDPTDIDENCVTNLADFAVIAADWLADYAITGPVPKPE